MNVLSKEESDDQSMKSPSRLIWICGMNICENINKFFNWIGEHGTHQGVDITYTKVLMFVFFDTTAFMTCWYST